MAHKAYTFDFLDTISKQLEQELVGLWITPLLKETLGSLQQFQSENNARQGVYLLYVEDKPVYLGKADDVCERLTQHREKLSGRQNIDMEKIGYKALLLDKSMSTAANEDLLISMFKKTHSGMWNGAGFGPKDPGQERDTTKPNRFDSEHPIKQDWPIDFSSPPTRINTLAGALAIIKAQVPYVFRYKLDKKSAAMPVDLNTLPKTAVGALTVIASILGPAWKGVVLAHGMVLYKTTKDYPHGKVLP